MTAANDIPPPDAYITREYLDLRLGELEARIHLDLERGFTDFYKAMNRQTWMMIGTFLPALVALVVAVIIAQ